MAKAKAIQTDLPPRPAADVDYVGLSRELATLLASLEQGELGVDAAVQAYERGLLIVTTLETHLQQAENRVSELRVAQDKLYERDASEEE